MQRSGPLAAWTAAWLSGRAASDEVLRAVTGSDAAHRLRRPDGVLEPLGQALIDWRRGGGPVLLALPVPGDVRGVPGPAAFRDAALGAGEAVVGGGLGLVPERIEHAPSSAPPSMVWHAYAVEQNPADPLWLTDIQHELTEAIRVTATRLSTAEVAGWAEGVGAALADARRAGERLNLPPGHPPPAVHLVAQAERLQAVLGLAEANPIGGAIDRVGLAARTEALRPLANAVRRARLAGYNAAYWME